MYAWKTNVSLQCLLRPCRIYSYNRSLSSTPWFVDPDPALVTSRDHESSVRNPPPHIATPKRTDPPSLPPNLPHYILELHSELLRLPQLEPAALEVRPPIPSPPGPPLPSRLPKGRRKRGRTDAGLGVPEPPGGIWRWIVLAQVKEGTENRGSIQSVLRVVRKTLLMAKPPLSLPQNRKRQFNDGWAMIDAGEFAVHVLSKSANEIYFPREPVRVWEW